jgi:hypothetical protein
MSQQMARKVVLSAAGFALLITYVEFKPPWEKDLQFIGTIRYAFLGAFLIGVSTLFFGSTDDPEDDPEDGEGRSGGTHAHYRTRVALVVATLVVSLAFAALVVSFITSEPLAVATRHAHLT